MATIKDVLFKMVTDSTDVQAYIMANGIKRMYPVAAPDNVQYPYISYLRINKDTSIGERLDGPPDLVGDLFALNIWCPKVGPAPGNMPGSEMGEDLGQKVKTVLNGFKGTILSVDIQKIVLENELDGWESDLETFRVTQQYRVFHRKG